MRQGAMMDTVVQSAGMIYRISRPIRRTMNFLFEILEKNGDGCILILVIQWKKTGLLHILLQESKPFKSSDTNLMIWK
jgi:hypothetical protein